MKQKITILALMLVGMVGIASAQNYKQSRYYNRSTGRLDYSQRINRHYDYRNTNVYYGFRVGPSLSTVSSESPYLDGGNTKTGLNIGFAAGFGLSYDAPIFLETGLYYTEKGGKTSSRSTIGKTTYNLEYLEVPFTFKYIYSPDGHFAVEPFVGGYAACGVGGKIKDYSNREAYSAFTDNYPEHFKRFDCGLKLGCGISYDMFYAEVAYDLGLAEIGNNSFDSTKNRTLLINLGVNF